MRRREFLKATALGSVAVVTSRLSQALGQAPGNLAQKMPRWRGFNLLEKFQAPPDAPGVATDAQWMELLKKEGIHHGARFLESDFQWMADWGFDFVRLPMDYRCWTNTQEPYSLYEPVLAEIDEAVEFGRKHGIHVSLNLHRAPGYTVAKPAEKWNLWADEEAQKQFDFQWSTFAKRYRGIPSTQLSFNLVNEPGAIAPEAYAGVVRRVTAAIRREDPDRLVVADGLKWGRVPVELLADLGIAQSTRGYDPMRLTHYRASWMDGSDKWPAPTWPLTEGGQNCDRAWYLHNRVEPWKKLEAQGVGVHVGEWGAYNKTPHEVVLPWARDLLGLWQEAGWGWALWNFRGSFGILDSGRADVVYEDFHGHQLDRKFLDLLRES
jgi:endoglucanase